MRIVNIAAIVSVLAIGACASQPKETASNDTIDTAPTAPAPVVRPTPQPPQVTTGPLAGSTEDFRVTVGDRVFFALDRFDLSPDAQETLQKQATWLRRYGNVRVRVEGNADERGTREYNLALGARRAASVKDYLVSLGVPASRIDTVSYGKERPLDPRSNEEAWSLNRNAHTAIVSGAIS